MSALVVLREKALRKKAGRIPGLCKSDKVEPFGRGLAGGLEPRLDGTSVLSRLVSS